MTREIICYEGKHPVNGKSIAANALKWDDKPLPIVSSPAGNGQLIGHAIDLNREEDGAITAELVIKEEYAPALKSLPEGWGWTIYATKVEWEDDNTLVTNGLIRQVYYAPDLPWGKK